MSQEPLSIDPNFQPDQVLVLAKVAGGATFLGFPSMKLAKAYEEKHPRQAVVVIYVTTASFGTSRHDTLAEAMTTKASYSGKSPENIAIQPAVPPDNLDSDVAAVYYRAPRDTDFPEFWAKLLAEEEAKKTKV